MTQTRKPSLAEEIAEANSLSEIESLLAKGAAFTNATRRSERLWQKTAKKRRAELGAIPA